MTATVDHRPSEKPPFPTPPAARHTGRLLIGVALSVLALAAHVAREALAVAPLVSSDQLNIATFALSKNTAGVFAGDYSFGNTDPARFYTPWQVNLVWVLWQLTGSPELAFTTQIPVIALASFALTGAAAYWLCRNLVVATFIAISATMYRPLPLGGLDIWGVGPVFTALPRSWAGPLVVLTVAVWIRAVERADGRLLALSGLLVGLLVNVHPPTGVPATAALLLASFVIVIWRRRGDWHAWASLVGAALLAVVGALPFLSNYASTGTVAIGDQFDAYLEAVRYRLNLLVWPDVLQRLRNTFLIRAFEEVTKPFQVAILILGTWALMTGSTADRRRGQALLVLGAAVLVVTVPLALAVQIVLMQFRLSPIPAIELLRGMRLVVVFVILLGGLGIASLLERRTPRAQLAALGLGFMLIADPVSTSLDIEFPYLIGWPTLAITAAIAGLFAAYVRWTDRVPSSVAAWLPRTTEGHLLLLLVGLPAALLLGHVFATGRLFSPPSPAPAALATAEVVDWASRLQPGTVIDTSAARRGVIAMRLRLDARQPVTLNSNDGAALLYAGSPSKAIDWHQRTLRATEAETRGDTDALMALAREHNAGVVLIERREWNRELRTTAIGRLGIRWAAGVTETQREEAVRTFKLFDPEFVADDPVQRTWFYWVEDFSEANIQRIMDDPRVQEMGGLIPGTLLLAPGRIKPALTVPILWENSHYVALPCCD